MTDASTVPTPTLRKSLLRAMLAFLVITAAIAILDVWTDIDHDGRILATSAVISFASLLALAGAVQLDHNPRVALGLVTLMTSWAAGALTLYIIWLNPRAAVWTELVVSLWLWAFATSVHSLLALARLPPRRRWLGVAAPLVSYFATLFSTGLIFEFIQFDEYAWYLLVTAYILATLASLVVLVIHLMHRHDHIRNFGPTLTLVSIDGEIFQDPTSAKRYRVTALN